MKILLLFIFTSQAYAFINIESLRQNAKPGLTKSGKILYNEQAGNTEKILYSLGTLNSYKHDDYEYLFIGNMRYGESFDRKDTEDGNLHIRFTRSFSKLHHAEIYSQYEYNNFKALTARRLIGLGYRLTLEFFNIGIGAFDENEAINPGLDQTAVRGNFYLSSTIKNKTGLEMASILYVQPSLRYGDDMRTLLNTGISQKVSKSVAMLIEFKHVYDQNPPTNIKKYDSSFMFGFNFH